MLTPMGVLTPRLRTLDCVDCPTQLNTHVTFNREKEKKTPLIVATMLCLQCPKAGHAPNSDQCSPIHAMYSSLPVPVSRTVSSWCGPRVDKSVNRNFQFVEFYRLRFTRSEMILKIITFDTRCIGGMDWFTRLRDQYFRANEIRSEGGSD